MIETLSPFHAEAIYPRLNYADKMYLRMKYPDIQFDDYPIFGDLFRTHVEELMLMRVLKDSRALGIGTCEKLRAYWWSQISLLLQEFGDDFDQFTCFQFTCFDTNKPDQ